MSLFFGAYYPEGIRFGYRIDKNNPDPYERVSYLYDAVGMTPAKMDFAADKFNYGSWNSAWFVKNNIPVILSQEGEIVEYLNPDNYLVNTDGEDVSEYVSYRTNNNVMAQIPLCYVKRYEDENYQYEIISNKRYDEDYFAYAHTDIDGKIKDNFYCGAFASGGGYHGDVSNRLVSLDNQDFSQGQTVEQLYICAKLNGEHWNILSWSQHELLRTWCTLLGKSTNSQAVFGNGVCGGNTTSFLAVSGNLKNRGQFYGLSTSSHMKAFHIEDLWGNQWDAIVGLINIDGTIYVKMTPEYTISEEIDGYGYTDTELTPVGNTSTDSYITKTRLNKYGMLPIEATGGSANSYYCDTTYTDNTKIVPALVGGSSANALNTGGISTLNFGFQPALADRIANAHITYV